MKMKRVILCFLLCALLLTTLGGCGTQPDEQLYQRFKNREEQFVLYTDDVDAAFVKMFTAHPEQLVYLDTVSTQPQLFGFKVTLQYTNTKVDAAEILCGTEEEVALQALCRTLEKAEGSGMMVLRGSENPDPESYSKQLAGENYLVTMGLKGGAWQVVSNDFTKDVLVSYTLEYHDTPEKVLSCRKAVAGQVDKLAKTLWQQDTPAEQRVRAIHDHLIRNTQYYEGEPQVMVDHTPYGPLLQGRGVCDGYTYAAKLLLDAAGVENRVISGKAGGEDHSWNVVKLGENYYHMDVTWDDPVDPTGAEHLMHDYYLKSDADFLKDHVWNPNGLPDCDKSYN